MTKRITIVVPVYHNAGSLRDLMARFRAVAERNEEEFEFIFVDDGSRDDSYRVLEELAGQDPRVRAIRLARNFGANAASAAGISQATGDAVVAISADLQDPPELIDQMLAQWRAGFRIVLAARSGREDPWLASQFSNVFWKLFRKFAVPTMPPHGCDFCLVDRQVLNALSSTHEPNAGLGMLLWTGFEPAVIYYHRRQRDARYGRSMWSWSKKIGQFIDSFVSFSNVPVRAASLLGIAMAVLGLLYAALVVLSRLFDGYDFDQRGWASLIVVILVVAGTQLVMIGILGEYLLRVLEVARNRPPFVIDQMVGGGAPAPNSAAPQAHEARPRGGATADADVAAGASNGGHAATETPRTAASPPAAG